MNSLLSKKELRDALKQETSLVPLGPFCLSGSRSGLQDPDPESGSSHQINPDPKHCSQSKKNTLTVPL